MSNGAWQFMGGGSRRQWFYKSEDFLSEMLSTSYLDDHAADLRAGDIVHAVCVDNLGQLDETVVARRAYKIESVTGGVVTVAARAARGTSFAPEHYFPAASGDVVDAGLHSNAATQDGLGLAPLRVGFEQTPIVSIDYDANGVDPGLEDKPIRWLMTGGANPAATLVSGGRFSFTMNTAALDYAYAPGGTDRYPLSVSGGYFVKRSTGGVRLSFPGDDGWTTDMRMSATGKPAKTKIDLAYNGADTYMFLGGLPYGRAIITPPVETGLNSAYAGGLTVLAGYWFPDGTASIENMKVNTTPFTYTAHTQVPSVMFFGDSFTTQGAPNHTPWLASGVKAPWLPGPGFASDGVTPAGGGSFGYDVGYLCEFFRALCNGGFLTVNDKNPANTLTTTNQAVSGGRFDTALARITPMTTVPKLCIIGLGTNDIAGQRTAGSVQSNLRAIVTALLAKGAERIVFWVPPSLRLDPTYRTTTYDNVQTAINAEIAAMPAFNPRCFVVDLFTYFGGFSVDTVSPSKFQSGGTNIHPNELGSTEIGALMGAAAIAALTTAL